MSFFIRSGDGGGSKGKAGPGGFAGKKRKLAEDSEGNKFKKVIVFFAFQSVEENRLSTHFRQETIV